MSAFSNISLTINSGSAFSDIADIRKSTGLCCLVANALTSCQLFFQIGIAANSASLKRADNSDAGPTDTTSTLVWSVGIGDRALEVGKMLSGANFFRVETSVTQTDTRSLTISLGNLL